MALADFTPERYRVVYKGKLLAEVRGLSLEDVSVLVRANMAELMQVYEATQKGGNALQDLNSQGVLTRIVAEMPGLAAKIIALAADEPHSDDMARKLPLPLQVQVITEVVRLTFEDVGGPKAFVALIAEMIGKQLPAGMLATTQTP